MIAIPGDTKATTISGIIADEMAIGMVNQKTTAVRLIPVIGKGVGEMVEFGGLLGLSLIHIWFRIMRFFSSANTMAPNAFLSMVLSSLTIS